MPPAGRQHGYGYLLSEAQGWGSGAKKTGLQLIWCDLWYLTLVLANVYVFKDRKIDR